MKERAMYGGQRTGITSTPDRGVSPTVAMPRPSGEPLPPLYSHGVMRFYAPFIHVAVRLREAGCTAQNAQVLRQELHRRLGEASAFHRAGGGLEEDVQLAELAAAAMLDSAALAGPATVRAAWGGETLEQQRFGSEIAGERFFVAYEQLLSGERPELLELFLWAMRTGFSGGRGAAEIAALVHQGEQLLSRNVRVNGPLYVPNPSSSKVVAPPKPSLPSWAFPAMAALFFIGLMGLVSALMFAQANAVEQELVELASRLGGARP